MTNFQTKCNRFFYGYNLGHLQKAKRFNRIYLKKIKLNLLQQQNAEQVVVSILILLYNEKNTNE